MSKFYWNFQTNSEWLELDVELVMHRDSMTGADVYELIAVRKEFGGL